MDNEMVGDEVENNYKQSKLIKIRRASDFLKLASEKDQVVSCFVFPYDDAVSAGYSVATS